MTKYLLFDCHYLELEDPLVQYGTCKIAPLVNQWLNFQELSCFSMDRTFRTFSHVETSFDGSPCTRFSLHNIPLSHLDVIRFFIKKELPDCTVEAQSEHTKDPAKAQKTTSNIPQILLKTGLKPRPNQGPYLVQNWAWYNPNRGPEDAKRRPIKVSKLGLVQSQNRAQPNPEFGLDQQARSRSTGPSQARIAQTAVLCGRRLSWVYLLN